MLTCNKNCAVLYKCDPDKKSCIPSKEGGYKSIVDCSKACAVDAPTMYECDTTKKQCLASKSGTYKTLNDCSSKCNPAGSAPDRYVCEEGGVATNGFYRCIVDNAKKYPLARSCGTVNNIYTSGGKIVNYNTGCAIKKPVTLPAVPIGFCNIIAFQ